MSSPLSPPKLQPDQLPPSPPKSPVLSLSRIVSCITALRHGDSATRSTARQTFSLSEAEYARLGPCLREVGLWGFYQDKVRHDYDPSLHQFTLRMPTPRHDVFVRGFVELMLSKIRIQARSIEQNYPAVSERLLQLQSMSTTDIRLLVEDRPATKSPDASLGYPDREYPQAVFEVSYSQDRRALSRLAWSYIMGSSHDIRCVVGLDLDYPRNRETTSSSHSHKANISIWRPLTEIEGNIENMDVKQEIANQCLGEDDNSGHVMTVLTIRDLLGDSLLESASSDVAARGINITSEEMTDVLKNAEHFQQSSARQTEKALQKRQARGRNWRKRRITPDEELSEGRQSKFRTVESIVDEQKSEEDTSYTPATRSTAILNSLPRRSTRQRANP